jgi:SAM-dependent methyltransferase
MLTIDQLYVKLRECVQSDDLEIAMRCAAELKRRIQGEITDSSRRHIVRSVENILDGRHEAFILDYGCGGGRTVVYLYLLGFRNVHGIDLKSQELNNKVMKLLGVESTRCFQYDGTVLPFDSNMFDCVFSEQVLEHVHDIDGYYRESSRVLKPGATAFFSFPHKFIPYDSHGRTWFAHMLPDPITRFCYRILGRDVDYLTKLLNFQTIPYHKKVAALHFIDITNIASERMKHFSQDELQRYKGNKKLRKAVDVLVKQDVLGPLVLKLISQFAIADLLMRNGEQVEE